MLGVASIGGGVAARAKARVGRGLVETGALQVHHRVPRGAAGLDVQRPFERPVLADRAEFDVVVGHRLVDEVRLDSGGNALGRIPEELDHRGAAGGGKSDQEDPQQGTESGGAHDTSVGRRSDDCQSSSNRRGRERARLMRR